MECNKDEAIRAKLIADGKMERKDYSGARKFALKAQTLYPDLEGISQMLTTIDVYVSAENKISGEVDWYGVLGAKPSMDDETLRKLYRKLLLSLHPDKNKSVGADGAFKLLSEAWDLLSDKAKRLAYNQRTGSRGLQQKVKTHPSGPSAPPRANGFHNASSRPPPVPKPKHTTAPKAVPTPARQRNDTFWTACLHCKMNYEYLRVYVNKTLRCQNCGEAFFAKEMAPPFSHPIPSNSGQNPSGSTAPRSVPTGHRTFKHAGLQRGQSSTSSSGNNLDPSISPAHENLKRERVASHFDISFSKEETLFKKSRGNMDYGVAMSNNFGSGSSGANRGDLHDFNLDRSENSIGDNEVWAAYDNDDGMPRLYALINKVISSNPFKVKFSWLNSKTNSEFATIEWVGSGFYKTCGEFKIGKYEMSRSINSFSHKVSWFEGPRGTVQIFPKKGDVWALYANWSSDWNEYTPDEVVHKYELVLVLNDFNEEQGISVAPLVKVDGFRTVFYPRRDPEKIRQIPKQEMFRFSHQVPNYLLTGEEVKNAPGDCQELDPASTPVELLQVAGEDKGSVGDNNGDATVTEQVC